MIERQVRSKPITGPARAQTPSCSRPNPRYARPRGSCSGPRTATPTRRPQIDSAQGHPGNREVPMTAFAITGMGLTGVHRAS
jgi:hypothetical protein